MTDDFFRICNNKECGKNFEPKAHNAIYCSDECRKKITNKRVLEKYYEKKSDQEFKKNTKRICASKKCKTILSRYNDDEICSSCQVKSLKDRLEDWGWDREKLDEDWSY